LVINSVDLKDIGKKVYDNEIEIKNVKEDEFIETKISINNYLKHMKEELGHLIIFVEPIQENW
jgi:hypothetical protein